jgi:hypothetical protein
MTVLVEDGAVEVGHADPMSTNRSGTKCVIARRGRGEERRTRLARPRPEAAIVSMLNALIRVLLIVLLAVTVTGCAAITGIFKAGVWVGVIIAVIVVGLVMMLFRRA